MAKSKSKEIAIKSPKANVEVETVDTVGDALGQLCGYLGLAFIGGANQQTVNKSLEVTKSTTIGVLDNQGNVIKPPTRKRMRARPCASDALGKWI